MLLRLARHFQSSCLSPLGSWSGRAGPLGLAAKFSFGENKNKNKSVFVGFSLFATEAANFPHLHLRFLF